MNNDQESELCLAILQNFGKKINSFLGIQLTFYCTVMLNVNGSNLIG